MFLSISITKHTSFESMESQKLCEADTKNAMVISSSFFR